MNLTIWLQCDQLRPETGFFYTVLWMKTEEKYDSPIKWQREMKYTCFFVFFSFSVSSFYSFSHTFILIYLFSLALYKCFFKPSLSLCIYIIHNIFYVSFLFLSFAVFSLTFLFLIIIYLCNFFVFLHFSFVLLIKRLNS